MHADGARNAARLLVDQRHRLAGEDLRADAAGGPDAAGDVGRRLLQRQRPQLAAQRDPLLQLPKRRCRSAASASSGWPAMIDGEQLLARWSRCSRAAGSPRAARAAGSALRPRSAPSSRPPRAALEQRFELGEQRGLRRRAPVRSTRSGRASISTNSSRVSAGLLTVDAVHPVRLPLDRGADQRRLARAGFADEQRDALAAAQCRIRRLLSASRCARSAPDTADSASGRTAAHGSRKNASYMTPQRTNV